MTEEQPEVHELREIQDPDMPDKVMAFFDVASPKIHDLLLRCRDIGFIVYEGAARTKFCFTGSDFEKIVKESSHPALGWLDRQVTPPGQLCKVYDGSYEFLMSHTISKGRRRLGFIEWHAEYRENLVGKKFWIDPATYHREYPEQFNMGDTHKDKREAEVTVKRREGFTIVLTFEDGHEFHMDIDEMPVLCWVPDEEEHEDGK